MLDGARAAPSSIKVQLGKPQMLSTSPAIAAFVAQPAFAITALLTLALARREHRDLLRRLRCYLRPLRIPSRTGSSGL